MKKWLVIGKNGQLSLALAALLGDNADSVGMDELDLSNPSAVQPLLQRYQPTAVLNAAAYTQVDKAESEQTLARAINATSVAEMAVYCKAADIPLVHISTDYVFDGSGHAPRTEEVAAAPLNVYGQTKLEGEQAITHTGGRYMILRTSWVFDDAGKNFLNTMLGLGKEREQLAVVSDQVGAPTYAMHLAQAMVSALQKAQAMSVFPSGIFHACGAGETSWHGFATAIFEQARKRGEVLAVREVKAIETSHYPTPAKRPLNSRLDCSKLERVLGVRLPHWEQGLSECMERKYAGA